MADRPRTVLGWIFGSDQAALDFLRRVGLEPLLVRLLRALNRGLYRVNRWLR
jgi:hypothetical protein